MKTSSTKIRHFLIVFSTITLLFTFTVLASSIHAEASDTGNVDALSYKMNLRLDTKNNRLHETVTITFKNNTNKALSEIYIRDMTAPALKYANKEYPETNKNKKSKIKSIRLKSKKKNLKFKYKKSKSVLVVRLSKKVKPGKTCSVVVRMCTDIPNRQDRFGVQSTKQGKLYALSFCFPYLADNNNGKWITDPFFDDGESRSFDLANYSVTFTAPKSYKVAATGESKTKRGKTTIKAKKVRDFAIVACNFMEKETFKVSGIKVNNYYLKGGHYKQYRKLSKKVAVDSIRLFTDYVGKYPYEELDMVECLFGFAFGGMEYPGLVMINGTTYYSSAGNKYGAQSLAEIVSHEIGHQWFYSSVGNNEYREGWIDEGFTTFLERDTYGLADCESNKYLRKIDKYVPSIENLKKEQGEYLEMIKTENKSYYVNIAPNKYPKNRSYGEGEYEGGYLFLLEVRNQLGEEKFQQFIREYYNKYYFKKATTKNIVALIKKYDSSIEMTKIINYYVA